MIKKVGNSYYVHISNITELNEKLPKEQFEILRDCILATLYVDKYWFANYDIVKFNKEKATVTLIKSEDWFDVNEPTVGDYIIINSFGEIKEYKYKSDNPQIYHHKWMFMADDWEGAEESKKRTELLKSIPSFNTTEVKSRIGYKKYWTKWCEANGIEL